MGINRIRDLVVHTLNNECPTSFGRNADGGWKLTRETPPGECGRKVKLKGIEETYTRGGACGLIRIPRKTLPIFVLVLCLMRVIKLTGVLDKTRVLSYDID